MWFPLWKEQMELDERFGNLSPFRKVLYFELQSLYNLFGRGLRQSDLWLSIATNQSIKNVRTVRKIFKEHQWVDYKSGIITKDGRRMPTIYSEVKWARTPKSGSGHSFQKMERLTFEVILEYLRRGHLTHADVAAYMTLAYWHGKYENAGDPHQFYIAKNVFRKISGFYDVASALERLSKIGEGGSRLFSYNENHWNYHISEFYHPYSPDPSKAVKAMYADIDKGCSADRVP